MTNLRIPGPTPCPDGVLDAMGRQMINHRGAEFMQVLQDATTKLKTLFMTANDLFVLTGSGTGGLEAAVVNTLSPGDKVLAVSIGVFGDRFGTIAKSFGADVAWLKSEWGKAADPVAIHQGCPGNPERNVHRSDQPAERNRSHCEICRKAAVGRCHQRPRFHRVPR